MPALTAEMIVKLVDQVTGPANKAARSLRNLQNVGGVQGVSNKFTDMLEKNNAALERARGGMLDAVGGFFALKEAIAGPVEAAMNFQSAMADVRKVVNFPTPKAFTDFQQQLLDMSKTIPTSVEGLAQIAANAGQSGIPDKDILKFTEDAAKVGVAFDISADQASNAMAHLMTGLGLNVDQVVSLTDAMNNLSNNQASSASEILDVVTAVGSQAKTFGFTAEQVAAFGSAMVSAGAQTDVAVTSFRNMGNALTKGSAATKGQRQAYKALGLDAVAVAKRMQKDAVGTTLDVMERIAKLPDYQRNAIATKLFGNEARALPTLLTNLPLLEESLGMVANKADYAGSSFKEYEIRSKTFGNSLQLFKNRLTALGITIGNALMPPLSDLMDKLSPIIDGFAKWSEQHPGLIAGILGTAGSLIAFKMAMSTLSFVGLIGKGGALSILAGTFKTIAKYAGAAKEAVGLQTALAAMDGAKMTGFDKLVVGIGGMARAAPGVGALGGAIDAIGAAVGAISLPVLLGVGAGVALVAGAGFLVWKYWDRLSSIFQGVADALKDFLQPALEPIQPWLDKLADIGKPITDAFNNAWTSITNFFAQFADPEKLTGDQKEAFRKAGNDWMTSVLNGMKDMMAGILQWFATWPQQILGAIGTIDIGSVIHMPSLPSLFGDGQPSTGSMGPRNPLPSGATTMTPPHRASGGPVWPGGSFLVGERQPEVFSPGRSGTVTPLSKLGGQTINLTVNVTGVAGDAVAIGREVGRRARDELASVLRGLHGDAEARY